MTLRLTFLSLAYCALAFISLPCQSSDDIQIGDTRKIVIQKLGQPTVSVQSRKGEFCYFKKASVDFVNGKVVSYKMMSAGDLLAQKQRDEKGRIILEQQKAEALRLKRKQEREQEIAAQRAEYAQHSENRRIAIKRENAQKVELQNNVVADELREKQSEITDAYNRNVYDPSVMQQFQDQKKQQKLATMQNQSSIPQRYNQATVSRTVSGGSTPYNDPNTQLYQQIEAARAAAQANAAKLETQTGQYKMSDENIRARAAAQSKAVSQTSLNRGLTPLEATGAGSQAYRDTYNGLKGVQVQQSIRRK